MIKVKCLRQTTTIEFPTKIESNLYVYLHKYFIPPIIIDRPIFTYETPFRNITSK